MGRLEFLKFIGQKLHLDEPLCSVIILNCVMDSCLHCSGQTFFEVCCYFSEIAGNSADQLKTADAPLL